MFFLPCLAQEKPLETSKDEESPRKEQKELKNGELPKELKAKLAITKEEKTEYKALLKASKAKIAKIWNDLCPSQMVIDVNDTLCLEQATFLFGSRYFFRNESGRELFGYIYLVKKEFWVQETSISQILIDLGEINLSRITKETEEVRILDSFPLAEYAGQGKIKSLSMGIDFQGLKINDKLPAQLNHTYLLRAFYRQHSFWGIDSIFAFQMVKEKDNVITILWKKVRSK